MFYNYISMRPYFEAANYSVHKINPGKINVIDSTLGYTKPLC